MSLWRDARVDQEKKGCFALFLPKRNKNGRCHDQGSHVFTEPANHKRACRQAKWCKPVTPALGRQSQGNQELHSQCKGYIRPCLRTSSLSFTALLKGRVLKPPLGLPSCAFLPSSQACP